MSYLKNQITSKTFDELDVCRKRNDIVSLILRFSDGTENCYKIDRFEAESRFYSFVRMDLEIGFSSLVSVALVCGSHLRYYYETNHYQKHVNYY